MSLTSSLRSDSLRVCGAGGEQEILHNEGAARLSPHALPSLRLAPSGTGEVKPFSRIWCAPKSSPTCSTFPGPQEARGRGRSSCLTFWGWEHVTHRGKQPHFGSGSLHCQRVSEQEGDPEKGFSVEQNVDSDTFVSRQGRVRGTQGGPNSWWRVVGCHLSPTDVPPLPAEGLHPPGWRWGSIGQDHSSYSCPLYESLGF